MGDKKWVQKYHGPLHDHKKVKLSETVCNLTYLPSFCIDVVISCFSSNDCGDLHTIRVTCLTVHCHI